MAGLVGEAEADGRPVGAVYRGHWVSDSNGHRGRLNMKVLVADDASYRVRFTGTFLKVIPFMYSADLAVTGRTADGVALSSTMHLPLFGEFSSTGTLTADAFNATYTSRKDDGRFVMRRAR